MPDATDIAKDFMENFNKALKDYEDTAKKLDQLLVATSAGESTRHVAKRVFSALADEPTRDYVKSHYLEALQDNIQRLEDKYRQSFLTLLTFSFIFLLLTYTQVTEASLGIFKISDISLIIQIFPIVIAYSYYELTMLDSLLTVSYSINYYMMLSLYPYIPSHNLDDYLFSSSSQTAKVIAALSKSSGLSKVITTSSGILNFIIFLLPIPLEIYAFYWCFKTYGVTTPFVWVSLVISAFFIFQILVSIVPVTEAVSTHSFYEEEAEAQKKSKNDDQDRDDSPYP